MILLSCMVKHAVRPARPSWVAPCLLRLYSRGGEVPLEHPSVTIWGANTGVGKTLISAGLARAAVRAQVPLLYLKPVQTGYPTDSDCRLVDLVCQSVQGHPNSSSGSSSSSWQSRVLFTYSQPIGPHLAAQQEGPHIGDGEVACASQEIIQQWSAQHPARVLPTGAARAAAGAGRGLIMVETAGGVASPAPSGTLQGDLYRPLGLPALLVGDPALGGISTTLTAYEALLLRGYDVAAVTMMRDGRLDNISAVAQHLRGAAAHRLGRVLPVVALPVCQPSKPGQKEGGVQGLDDHLMEWLEQSEGQFQVLLELLQEHHQQRVSWLQGAAAAAEALVWWPFTQHGSLKGDSVAVVDARVGDDWLVYKEHTPAGGATETAAQSCSSSSSGAAVAALVPQHDSCSSWWTQTMNAGLQQEVVKAVAYGAGRYNHVLWPEVVHAPGLTLTQQILNSPLAAGWGSRVFFSDDGSTGIEVALKMAFRKFMVDHDLLDKQEVELQVVALENNYHGDTLGAMDCAAASPFNGRLQTPWYSGRGLFMNPPYLSLKQGRWHLRLPPWLQQQQQQAVAGLQLEWPGCSVKPGEGVFDVGARMGSQLVQLYRAAVEAAMDEYEAQEGSGGRAVRLGTLLMEPLLQGAGGMLLVDPAFQKVLVQVCRSRKVPVVYDEVFTGCWRLGPATGGHFIEENPDVACFAKLLTAGVAPLAATVATESVFESFKGSTKAEALLHGHSYTAYPLACMAATASLHILQQPQMNPNCCSPEPAGRCPATPTCMTSCGKLKSQWRKEDMMQLSDHPLVEGVVSVGSVLALEVKGGVSGYFSEKATRFLSVLRNKGLFCRPLGGVVYVMATPTTPVKECDGLMRSLTQALDEVAAEQHGGR